MIHLYEIIFNHGGKMSLFDVEKNELVDHPEMILQFGMVVRVFERNIEIAGNRKFKNIVTKSIYLECVDSVE